MTVDDLRACVGEIDPRFDAHELTGPDRRCDDDPKRAATSEPAKCAFFQFKAIGRIEGATTLSWPQPAPRRHALRSLRFECVADNNFESFDPRRLEL